MTMNGAVEGTVFRTYVEPALAPTLFEGDIVIMDNLGAHKVKGSRQAIAGKNAKLIYLPSYSPDLKPLEKCRSKIKAYLRAAKARTREDLEKALKEVLLLITAEDAAVGLPVVAIPYIDYLFALSSMLMLRSLMFFSYVVG